MPYVQPLPWTEFMACPICTHSFGFYRRHPISLGCGHSVCRLCLASLYNQQCPFDQSPINVDHKNLPVNSALLKLATLRKGESHTLSEILNALPPSCARDLTPDDLRYYFIGKGCIEHMAVHLYKAIGNVENPLSRCMQRKLVTLINCQLMMEEGRLRAMRVSRCIGERAVIEMIMRQQKPIQLNACLWAAVRGRGCQFLGPVLQEDLLRHLLAVLAGGVALSRKSLVMQVVQSLKAEYAQASKTSVGHVVQLLYRASCFNVSKRECESSLMQLKEEFSTYDSLRQEHDAQIVQIAMEAGLRIPPEQWSTLLYGDLLHKSYMQSIIDRLQTPESFKQSIQELVLTLQRNGDIGEFENMRPELQELANIEISADKPSPTNWQELGKALQALKKVIDSFVEFEVRARKHHEERRFSHRSGNGASSFSHTARPDMEPFRNEHFRNSTDNEQPNRSGRTMIRNGNVGVPSFPNSVPLQHSNFAHFRHGLNVGLSLPMQNRFADGQQQRQLSRAAATSLFSGRAQMTSLVRSVRNNIPSMHNSNHINTKFSAIANKSANATASARANGHAHGHTHAHTSTSGNGSGSGSGSGSGNGNGNDNGNGNGSGSSSAATAPLPSFEELRLSSLHEEGSPGSSSIYTNSANSTSSSKSSTKSTNSSNSTNNNSSNSNRSSPRNPTISPIRAIWAHRANNNGNSNNNHNTNNSNRIMNERQNLLNLQNLPDFPDLRNLPNLPNLPNLQLSLPNGLQSSSADSVKTLRPAQEDDNNNNTSVAAAAAAQSQATLAATAPEAPETDAVISIENQSELSMNDGQQQQQQQQQQYTEGAIIDLEKRERKQIEELQDRFNQVLFNTVVNLQERSSSVTDSGVNSSSFTSGNPSEFGANIHVNVNSFFNNEKSISQQALPYQSWRSNQAISVVDSLFSNSYPHSDRNISSDSCSNMKSCHFSNADPFYCNSNSGGMGGMGRIGGMGGMGSMGGGMGGMAGMGGIVGVGGMGGIGGGMGGGAQQQQSGIKLESSSLRKDVASNFVMEFPKSSQHVHLELPNISTERLRNIWQVPPDKPEKQTIEEIWTPISPRGVIVGGDGVAGGGGGAENHLKSAIENQDNNLKDIWIRQHDANIRQMQNSLSDSQSNSLGSESGVDSSCSDWMFHRNYSCMEAAYSKIAERYPSVAIGPWTDCSNFTRRCPPLNRNGHYNAAGAAAAAAASAAAAAASGGGGFNHIHGGHNNPTTSDFGMRSRPSASASAARRSPEPSSLGLSRLRLLGCVGEPTAENANMQPIRPSPPPSPPSPAQSPSPTPPSALDAAIETYWKDAMETSLGLNTFLPPAKDEHFPYPVAEGNGSPQAMCSIASWGDEFMQTPENSSTPMGKRKATTTATKFTAAGVQYPPMPNQ